MRANSAGCRRGSVIPPSGGGTPPPEERNSQSRKDRDEPVIESAASLTMARPFTAESRRVPSTIYHPNRVDLWVPTQQ